jgi:succinate dehydrogenase hydrophobic anchor subunit
MEWDLLLKTTYYHASNVLKHVMNDYVGYR